MKVSYNWLREFVDIELSPFELADKLTMFGIAVENVKYLGENIDNVVVGKILSINCHPNADKLVICQVTADGKNRLQIVTGATNISEGDIVPVALDGAKLPNGVTIKKAKLRGEVSNGMLCSGEELGIERGMLPDDQQHGIMTLPSDTELGIDIKRYLHFDDYVLDLDLTPNRGDCLSVVGVAREVAALLGKKIKTPEIVLEEDNSADINDFIDVDIQSKDLCYRYACRLIKGVKIGKSPMWMQQRLIAAGIRPINNVVDVTNYVMLELGQPLHAFDYKKLSGSKIIVRNACDDEKIVTLDGVERSLTEDMLLICDAKSPVAVAGVMGGLHSEVSDETVDILIESACFNAINIRRTSKKLNLRSESSIRFEKGVDVTGCAKAADRAAELIQKLAGGSLAKGIVDRYVKKYEEKVLVLRPSRVEHILGVSIEKQDMKGILSSLEFKVEDEDGNLKVTVPSFRHDVTMEIDLIEEIARAYSYDKIPETLIYGITTHGSLNQKQKLISEIKNILVGCGLTEVITYGFIDPNTFDKMNIPSDSKLRDVLKLQNPLSEEQSVMRTVLVPNLLEVAQRNHNRSVHDVAIFEIGRVFYKTDDVLPDERTVLAVVLSGRVEKTWNEPLYEYDFYHLKGIIEVLFEKIGLKDLYFEKHSDPSFHPGRTCSLNLRGKMVGVLGELHPDVLENYKLPYRAVACKIDLSSLFDMKIKTPKYKKLPKFPPVERDLAVVVEKGVASQELINSVRKAGGRILKSAYVFDVYSGEQVPDGYKSIAFKLIFQADDRTLTDKEISKKVDQILNALEKGFKAKLRG
ncbi:MAG: phenylalanine--tRNA ligase subunit beta [Desulfotomaculum sp.]|nr:phenylalanine--tRNA ligase subunit beta [Desulfotomaculum sp.]